MATRGVIASSMLSSYMAIHLGLIASSILSSYMATFGVIASSILSSYMATFGVIASSILSSYMATFGVIASSILSSYMATFGVIASSILSSYMATRGCELIVYSTSLITVCNSSKHKVVRPMVFLIQFLTQATNLSKKPPVQGTAAMLNFHLMFLAMINSLVSLAVNAEPLSDNTTEGHPRLVINRQKVSINVVELVSRTTSNTTTLVDAHVFNTI